jgi:hypothetical protein
MNKVNSWVKEFKALVTGDSASATAEKVKRSADSALKVQLSSNEGKLISFEDGVDDAKENLRKARLNYGKTMSSESERDAYVSNLLVARNNVTKAEKALKDHKELLAFFKDELTNLDKTETEVIEK